MKPNNNRTLGTDVELENSVPRMSLGETSSMEVPVLKSPILQSYRTLWCFTAVTLLFASLKFTSDI